MNKRIAILLSVLLSLALFFVAVQAADSEEPMTVQTTVSRDDLKDLTQESGVSARNASSLPSGLKTAIANAILNCEESVDTSSYQLAYTTSLKAQISDFVFNSSPEHFNVKQIGYSRTVSDSPVLVGVYFIYSYSAADFSEMMDEIDAAAANLLNGVQGNTSLGDAEKALLVHDRLALRCEYDRLYLETNGASQSETSVNMYGALVARQAVCQGYAEAYKYLLNKVGVDCEVTSTDMMISDGQLAPHAWNIVYVNGAPYHADVTWDDPTNDITGRVTHKNFLISTAKLTSDREFISTDYDFDTSPARTTYDNYFWRNVNSAFTLLGQSIYYIDGSSSLSRYADRQSIYNIDASWPVFDKPGYYYTDPMARLATDGVDLFFNTNAAVYRYSVANGTATKVYTPAGSNRSIVGFAYEDGYFIGEFTSRASYTLSTKTEDGFRYQYKVAPSTEALSTANVALSWSSKAYNGSAQKPTVTVKNAAGNTLKKDTDYTLTYSNSSSKAPGSYTVTVTGKGGYTGTVTAGYTIAKQSLNAGRVSLNWTSKTYNGSVQKPTVKITAAQGGTLTEGSSYTVTYSYSANSKVPGTYTVTATATGMGNYRGTVTKNLTYTIDKQPLNAGRVSLNWTSRTYNGSVQKPTAKVTAAQGGVMTEGSSYTVSYSYSANSKAPGTYNVTVTATGKGNYTGTVTKKLTYTIAKQPLSASRVSLNWTSKRYNGSVQKPTAKVTAAQGGVMTEGSSYTVSYSYSANSKAPGTYNVTVTATGKGNYTGTVTKKLNYTIAKQPIDASRVTLSWSSAVYSGAVQKPDVTVKNAAGNVMTQGSSYTVSYSSGSKAPGKYTVTVTGSGYYSGSIQKTYTIAPGQVKNLKAVKVNADKATLTWSAVSGAEKYAIYYAAAKDGSYTAYGTTANTTCTVSKTGAGTMYYKVRAFVTASDDTRVYGAYSAVVQAK